MNCTYHKEGPCGVVEEDCGGDDEHGHAHEFVELEGVGGGVD